MSTRSSRLPSERKTGSDLVALVRIGSAGSAVNSKCSVDAAGVKVETKGTELAVTIPVTFAATFQGAKKIWVVAFRASQTTAAGRSAAPGM